MATLTKFEDLEIWKEARVLCKEVYKVTKREPFCKDFSLIKQIRSSTGSVMDNIAEGFERGGKKEFIHFSSISKGSCGEVRSQLYRSLDQHYILQDEFETMFGRTLKIGKGCMNFMKYLKDSEIKGIKFKR